jgi:hypothetical protein
MARKKSAARLDGCLAAAYQRRMFNPQSAAVHAHMHAPSCTWPCMISGFAACTLGCVARSKEPSP